MPVGTQEGLEGHIAWDYLSDLEKAQLLHFYPKFRTVGGERMTTKIYQIMHEGKILRKYQIWHKRILQGWLIGGSPEEICLLFGWDIRECLFEQVPFSSWDIAESLPIKKAKGGC